MHEAVRQMLAKYNCRSQQDYVNALKEIFQEITLLALWRAKFFEKAAFYGGSALRILYGLDRFSENLDFSLLKTDKRFSLSQYNTNIQNELAAFGFQTEVEVKQKNIDSQIESAFIKADTKKQLLLIETPGILIKPVHHMQKIKIKMEVDINPPLNFETKTQFLLNPIPFSVRSYVLPDLFAGKIHALLCRPWVKRVKGRDWYDFIWYISKEIPVHLAHLKARLVQSGAWGKKDGLNKNALLLLLDEKIKNTDFENAQQDISPFIKHKDSLSLWSTKFFNSLLNKIRTI